MVGHIEYGTQNFADTALMYGLSSQQVISPPIDSSSIIIYLFYILLVLFASLI